MPRGIEAISSGPGGVGFLLLIALGGLCKTHTLLQPMDATRPLAGYLETGKFKQQEGKEVRRVQISQILTYFDASSDLSSSLATLATRWALLKRTSGSSLDAEILVHGPISCHASGGQVRHRMAEPRNQQWALCHVCCDWNHRCRE